MKNYKWILILLNLALLLMYFNYSVVKKEELIKDGQLVLLELAPADPRSLMQGDYMALRYKISENVRLENLPKRGYCVVVLDQNNRAKSVRIQPESTPLYKGEHLIKYTSTNNWSINIGAESFFFQEGKADLYNNAKYGGVKIDQNGNSILIGLYDDHLREIK